jgi:hypothetical protein
MGRVIDATLLAALSAAQVCPVVMASFNFRSGTEYVWSGVGPLVWNGNTFKGVGSMGKVGDITECGESKAQGTSVQLSGIDPAWLGAAMSDIRQGAPARIWLGTWKNGALLGTPYLQFRGQIDKAPVSINEKTATITLNLETKLINHARANARRYTSADQHANGYPDDIAFGWVEQLNDQALYWDNG